MEPGFVEVLLSLGWMGEEGVHPAQLQMLLPGAGAAQKLHIVRERQPFCQRIF